MPNKRRVATAPGSCGDRLLVALSPYKSHILSWAPIQLGQHHLKPYAAAVGSSGRVTKSDLGQNSTPHPFSRDVLQPCSFDSHRAGWLTRSVSISIVHPYTPVVRLQGLCFSEQHAQTVGHLFPSAVVAPQTTTLG